MADSRIKNPNPETAAEPPLEKLAAGDPETFNDLVRRFHGSLYRLAVRLVRNEHDAQEIVQESFLAAYEGCAQFQGRSKVRTWLLSITYHKAVDRLKRTTRDAWSLTGNLEETPLWERLEKVGEFTDWGKDPEQYFQRAQLLETLEQALREVPAESRAVFELRDLQGMSSREVAETLGISEGAARVRLHRVRQFLMGRLQGLFGPESGGH